MEVVVENADHPKWMALALCVLACFAPATIGGLFLDYNAGGWYDALPKPSYTPPSWVFPLVWAALYLMMAIAAWLVWEHRHHKSVVLALVLFGLQLILNAAWQPLFFGMHNPTAALVDVILLWVVLMATCTAFSHVGAAPTLLMLPYLAWASFALILNAAIVVMSS